MTLLISLGLFITISLIIIVTAFFSPIPRKIGFRNVRRRLGNTLLVVIGSMVGTALIAGSLVLSDSLDKTFLRLVEEQVGEIDIIIEPEATTESEFPITALSSAEKDQLQEILDTERIDGVIPFLYFQTSPQKIDESGEAIINSYQVEFYAGDWEDLESFGSEQREFPFPESENGVTVSQSTADSLELTEGDRIKVSILSNDVILAVDHIIPDEGIFGGKRIVIPYESLQDDIGFNAKVYNFFLVSATGGIKPDNYDGDEFEEYVTELLTQYESESNELFATELKQEALNGFGLKSFVTIFLSLSLFGIFAGILLIVNLYAMLASERQMEMGILRAIALTRIKLMQAFVYEGFIYSIFSALLGTFVGVGIGYMLIYVIQNMFDSIFDLAGGDGVGFEVLFDVTTQSLVLAFVIGALITIVSSVFTSFRISNLNIVSAIRRLEETKRSKITVGWVIKTLLLGLFLLQGIASLLFAFTIGEALEEQRATDPENPLADLKEQEFIDLVDVIEGYLFYLGVVLIILFTTILIARILFTVFKININRFLYSASSVILIVFTAFMGDFEYVKDAAVQDEGVGIVFLSGLVLVISFSLIVTYNLDLLTRGISALLSPLGKIKPIVRMGLRYPAENRSRTGLTLVMFAVIIFLISFISIEKAVVNDQSEKAFQKSLSGYDVIVAPSTFGSEYNLLPEITETIASVEGVDTVDRSSTLRVTLPAYTYEDLDDAQYFGNPDDLPQYNDEDTYITNYSIVSESFLLDNDVELIEFSNTYANEDEAWAAVASDPSKVILGKAFSVEGYGPIPQDIELGDTLEISTLFGVGLVEKEVIGFVQGQQGANGIGVDEYIITTEQAAIADFGESYLQNLSITVLLADVNDSADIEVVVNTIKKELIDYNILFIFDIRELVGAIQGFINSLLALFQGFLAFSLIVGASGLAIIVVRSVNERRQQIGMLRSLGFQKRMILASFFIEATFITLTAIVIGVSMGIIGTNAVFEIASEENPDIELIIPWGEIIIISTVIYFSSLLFALMPSLKAAQLSPVEATNYPE